MGATVWLLGGVRGKLRMFFCVQPAVRPVESGLRDARQCPLADRPRSIQTNTAGLSERLQDRREPRWGIKRPTENITALA